MRKLVLAALLGISAGACDNEKFAMQQVRAWKLPALQDDEIHARLAPLPDGGAILHPDGHLTIVHTHADARTVKLPMFPDGSVPAIVSAVGRRIWVYDAAVRYESRIAVDLDFDDPRPTGLEMRQAFQVMALEHALAVTGRLPHREETLHIVPEGRPSPVSLLPYSAGGSAIDSVILRSGVGYVSSWDGDTLIYSARNSPDLYIVDPTHEDLGYVQVPIPFAEAKDSSVIRGDTTVVALFPLFTRGTGLARVGRHLIVSQYDPKKDRTRLIALDGAWQHISSATLPFRMYVIGSANNRLFAVRDINGLELVMYEVTIK